MPSQCEIEAGEKLREMLAKPIDVEGEPWLKGTGDLFNPWNMFPSLYGSYSSEFDDMAILVLDNIVHSRSGFDHGEGLAHQMFREMLCTANLCDYGISPRCCFPNWGVEGIEDLLSELLAKWKEYRVAEWESDNEPA